jgi:DNA repair ATPase RecN
MDPELAAALATISAKLETIEIKLNGLPLMAASLHELRYDVRELRRETRLVKAAINDMARVNITAGEVEALHDELDRIADAQVDIRARAHATATSPIHCPIDILRIRANRRVSGCLGSV